MSVETEVVLSQVKHVKNETNEQGEITKPAVRYLRFEERQSRETEMAQIDEVLSAPKWANPDLTAERRQDLARRRLAVQKELDRSAPKPLSPQAKDAVAELERELAGRIREGMPPIEVMRRNPAGAVDAHMRWEKAKKNAILAWKNCRVLLNPDSNEKDLCNVELLRPSIAIPGGASTFMADGQIPGPFAMTPLAKANWTLGEPTISTALDQAKEHEAREQVAPQDTPIPKRRGRPAKVRHKRPHHAARKLSPAEHKAWSEKMVAAKRDAQAKRDAEAAAALDAALPVL